MLNYLTSRLQIKDILPFCPLFSLYRSPVVPKSSFPMYNVLYYEIHQLLQSHFSYIAVFVQESTHSMITHDNAFLFTKGYVHREEHMSHTWATVSCECAQWTSSTSKYQLPCSRFCSQKGEVCSSRFHCYLQEERESSHDFPQGTIESHRVACESSTRLDRKCDELGQSIASIIWSFFLSVHRLHVFGQAWSYNWA